ncbi:MAG: CoA transferase [Halieaceae bacterium]|nr:CoA transferase [Halieaceae bacterium]
MVDEAAHWRGPLSGVRVLDLTRVLAGPAASLALADLGAEVIKVEAPGGGDETRSFPPHKDGESHYFLSINRGKKSIVVDLKSEKGVALLKSLVKESDILLENFRPGVMDKLGLGYSVLSELNPRLIYCAISGFGQTGPMRDQPSFDIVLQALSGAMSVNGDIGGQPVKMGIPLGDWVGGINAPPAILSALYERERTDQGRYIDVSLLDGMLNLLGYLSQLAFFNQTNPEPQGSQHPNLVPYGAFAAKDGTIIVACLTNQFWSRICNALDMPQYIEDPRFESLERRREARDEVNALINERTVARTIAELTDVFVEHRVPHAPILGVLEALSSEQARARDMVINVDHSRLGEIPIVNRPIKFGDEQMHPPTAPPVLGEHSVEVLRSVLGLSDEQIDDLRKSQVIN